MNDKQLLAEKGQKHVSHYNPYIVGAPVPPDKFYGRQRILHAILTAVKAKNHVAIYGERRIGKTSLLHRLELLLKEETDTIFLPLFIQMQLLSEDDFFGVLIDEVIESIPTSVRILLPKLVREISSPSYRGINLLQDLETVIKVWNNSTTIMVQFVFLLDEGDRLNEFSEETQMRLRGLLQKPLINQHVRLVWSGVSINHTWHSDTSPWFNLFKNEFYLSGLEPEEARHLILEPVAGIYNYSEDAILKIQELTQKKPYLIQWLCSRCINYLHEQGRIQGHVTLQDVETTWVNGTLTNEQIQASLSNPQTNDVVKKQKWSLPVLDQIFEKGFGPKISEDQKRRDTRFIEETLSKFRIEVKVREINRSPNATRFLLELGPKTRIEQIEKQKNDLALALNVPSVNLGFIPERPYDVGLAIPNSSADKVMLRSILESDKFIDSPGSLKLALGYDLLGYPIIEDLISMPNLLIVGTTGSGKSVCVNVIISCLLITHTPETLRLLLVKSSLADFANYNDIPHLLSPVVTTLKKMIATLDWAIRETGRRQRRFAQESVNNINNYNEIIARQGKKRMPYIVILIDGLTDLTIMPSDEMKAAFIGLAKRSHTTGIHIVITTNPSPEVITKPIKDNFPTRIAFAVNSQNDSKLILDSLGAERLRGRGDMIYMAAHSPKLQRLQGVFVSNGELDRLVHFWKNTSIMFGKVSHDLRNTAYIREGTMREGYKVSSNQDELLEKAIAMVFEEGETSVPLLQHNLRIEYPHAVRLMDIMEEQAIIGPDGSLTSQLNFE